MSVKQCCGFGRPLTHSSCRGAHRPLKIWDGRWRMQQHGREFLYSCIHNHHHVQEAAADSRLSGETAMSPQSACTVGTLPQRHQTSRPSKRPGKRLQHYAYARMPVSAATAIIDSVQRQIRPPNTLLHHTINLLPVAHGNNAPPRSLRKSAC